MFGNKKYLWGNVPAFDLLRLDANEGSGYNGDLRILCAGMIFEFLLYSEQPAQFSDHVCLLQLRGIYDILSRPLPNYRTGIMGQ